MIFIVLFLWLTHSHLQLPHYSLREPLRSVKGFDSAILHPFAYMFAWFIVQNLFLRVSQGENVYGYEQTLPCEANIFLSKHLLSLFSRQYFFFLISPAFLFPFARTVTYFSDFDIGLRCLSRGWTGFLYFFLAYQIRWFYAEKVLGRRVWNHWLSTRGTRF